MTVSILRPSTPPLLLTSSITASMALSMRGPSCPPAPVKGVSTPSLMASAWAAVGSREAAMAVAAAAPLISARRVVPVMANPSGEPHENTRPMSGPEKEPSDFRIRGKRAGNAGAAILAVDQNVGPIGNGERFVGILLDDRHCHAVLVDLLHGIEQALGGTRRQTG